MHPQAREAYIKRTAAIVEGAKARHAAEVGPLKPSDATIISDGSTILLLPDDIAQQYAKLLNLLLHTEHWEAKFLESTIDKALTRLVVRLFNEQSTANAAKCFDEFAIPFDTYEDEQVAYIPFDNLEMHIDSVQLGRMTLRRVTPALLGEIAKSIEESVKQSSHPDEEKALIASMLRDSVISRLRRGVKVVGEFRMVAGPDLVERRAVEECRRVLDLLRYAIPVLYGNLYPAHWYPTPASREQGRKDIAQREKDETNRYYIGVGLQGEVSLRERETLVLAATTVEFHWRTRRIGPNPYRLTQLTINTLQQLDVFKLASLYERRGSNTFTDALLRSIHWYAHAHTQFEWANQLLSLMTCLETLLTPPDQQGSIVAPVAEGAALLIGEDLEQRKDMVARIKDIYGRRSAISHHGHEDADELDIIELRYVAREVLQVMVKRVGKWTEHKQLFYWITERKLQ